VEGVMLSYKVVKLLVISLVCFNAFAFDEINIDSIEANLRSIRVKNSTFSPHDLSVDVLKHWRGSWGGKQYITHYSIKIMKGEKQLVELSKNYYVDSYYSRYAMDQAMNDSKKIEELLEKAKISGNKVFVDSKYDDDNLNDVTITEEEDVKEITLDQVNKLKDEASKLSSSDIDNLRVNRGILHRIQKIIKEIEQSK